MIFFIFLHFYSDREEKLSNKSKRCRWILPPHADENNPRDSFEFDGNEMGHKETLDFKVYTFLFIHMCLNTSYVRLSLFLNQSV
jgi:hypothetical protein